MLFIASIAGQIGSQLIPYSAPRRNDQLAPPGPGTIGVRVNSLLAPAWSERPESRVWESWAAPQPESGAAKPTRSGRATRSAPVPLGRWQDETLPPWPSFWLRHARNDRTDNQRGRLRDALVNPALVRRVGIILDVAASAL